MAKSTKIPTLQIGIVYDTREELEGLRKDPSFSSMILEGVFTAVEQAAATKKKTVDVLDIYNLGVMVSVERKNFKPILEKAIQHYTTSEQYEKCIQLVNLIDSL